MWEYKKKDLKFQNNLELVEFLNKEGNDNWEVIFFQEDKPENNSRHFSTSILLKRRKQLIP